METTQESEKTRLTEVWTVLVVILVLNAAFVWAISTNLLPQSFFGYGRFLLLGSVLALLVAIFRGPHGVVGLIRPMTVWRVSPWWYLFAVSWAPLLCSVVLAIKSGLIGGDAFYLDRGILYNPSGLRMVTTASFVGEIVWVSYAINRLSGRFTVLESSLIVGVFWTLWWMPIVVLDVAVIPGLSFGSLLTNMLGIAVTCGFVYAKTGSGLIVMILQVTLNLMLLVFPVAPYSGGAKTFWMFAVLYLLAALGLHIAFGPRPLLRGRKSAAATTEA